MTAALRAVWSNKALWGIHVVANAALFAAIYGWLWIPDQTAMHLLLSALAAIAILIALSWLHASTLEYFRTGRQAFRPSLRRIGLFAVWLVVLVVAILAVLQLRDQVQPYLTRMAAALPSMFRRPVTPVFMSRLLSVVLVLVAFVLLPFGMLVLWNRGGSRSFALSYVVVVGVCAYLGYELIWWVPKVSGLYSESVSLGIRFIAAYLLAVTGWLIIAAALPRREA
jgi:hypothetical protein